MISFPSLIIYAWYQELYEEPPPDDWNLKILVQSFVILSIFGYLWFRMYKKHNYEFREHRKSMIAQILAIIIPNAIEAGTYKLGNGG